jgi:hypothetical protein
VRSCATTRRTNSLIHDRRLPHCEKVLSRYKRPGRRGSTDTSPSAVTCRFASTARRDLPPTAKGQPSKTVSKNTMSRAAFGRVILADYASIDAMARAHSSGGGSRQAVRMRGKRASSVALTERSAASANAL